MNLRVASLIIVCLVSINGCKASKAKLRSNEKDTGAVARTFEKFIVLFCDDSLAYMQVNVAYKLDTSTEKLSGTLNSKIIKIDNREKCGISPDENQQVFGEESKGSIGKILDFQFKRDNQTDGKSENLLFVQFDKNDNIVDIVYGGIYHAAAWGDEDLREFQQIKGSFTLPNGKNTTFNAVVDNLPKHKYAHLFLDDGPLLILLPRATASTSAETFLFADEVVEADRTITASMTFQDGKISEITYNNSPVSDLKLVTGQATTQGAR